MNRYERVKEHLDTLTLEDLRLCQAKGSCACNGCAGHVNGVPVREHELMKYSRAELLPDQQKRLDIITREAEGLSEFEGADRMIAQMDYMKEGNFWTNFLHPELPISVSVQITGRNPGVIRVL